MNNLILLSLRFLKANFVLQATAFDEKAKELRDKTGSAEEKTIDDQYALGFAEGMSTAYNGAINQLTEVINSLEKDKNAGKEN